ncbi:MAG: GIY-YIG nuclease family protein [Candidatus Curtissbacteria bacterium]
MKSRSSLNKQWKWYVYIILCLDGTYYTGLTWKPELRLDQHLSGLGSRYTAKHGVKKVVYFEEHIDLDVARDRERQIKGWSQEKKLKLISGEWTNQW